MRIVLDARITQFGGAYSYSRALIKSIIEHDKENEYFIIYDSTHGKLNLDNAEEYVITSDNPYKWLIWNKIKLPKLISSYGADIYHSLRPLTNFRTKAKKIYTIHSAYPFLYPEHLNLQEKYYWVPMYKNVAKKSDGIIAVSHYDANNLVKYIPALKNKIHVTQLAADQRFNNALSKDELDSTSKRLNLPEKYVLYVGTIYPVKNVATVIKVFKQLHSEYDEKLKLVIVGRKGWGYEEVEQTIQTLGVTNNIIFYGHQFDLLPHIYSKAELLLFPSYYEAFPAPPLEAMACGTPVIASTEGGLPEVIGDAGMMRKPDDVTGLAACCKQVLEDKNKYTDLVEKGYKQVKKFYWKRCAEETIRIYEHYA